MMASVIPKCAIEDCDKPRYVDDRGKVHECCGYTHAMEYQRRQAVKKRKLYALIGYLLWSFFRIPCRINFSMVLFNEI